MRNCLIVEQRLALGVPSRGEPQLAFFIAQKYIATFGADQLQGRVDESHQNLIQYSDRIQFSSCFKKERELFEIRRVSGNLDSGELAQEFARRIGSCVLRAEDDIRDFAHPKLEPVVALKALALDALAIHEGSVFAALVNYIKVAILGDDHGVITRNTGVRDHEVLVDLAADGEGRAIQ